MHAYVLVALLAVPSQEVLQVATCARQGGEYEATLEGRIPLVRAFLDPAVSDEENAKTAVKQLVKYAWGWLRTNPAHRRTLKAVLSAEEPSIDVKLSAGTYGRDMQLPWPHREGHLLVEDPYTSRAVARGFTRHDDDALLVDYVIRFRMALCGPSRDVDSVLTVPLPDDPWLFSWAVPESEQRTMRYLDVTAVTNPCSDDDWAELPHPFYFWYDWWPDRHGVDEVGRPYDCRQLLLPGRDYRDHAIRLHRLSTSTWDFDHLRRGLAASPGPLTGTVLFGVQDHAVKAVDVEGLRARLGEGADLPARVRRELARDGVERGLVKFWRLLRDLPEVAWIAHHRATVEDGALVLQVDGVLRQSRRAVRLRFVYGMTDVFGPVPATHWSQAVRALGEDNLVVYVGHSGIGENLKLSRMESALSLPHDEMLSRLGRAPYQVVAFFSCYSYMYFGRDFMEAGPSGREFVYAGTEYTKGDRGTLALLGLVDGVLAGVERPALNHVHAEDFLLFKAHPPRP